MFLQVDHLILGLYKGPVELTGQNYEAQLGSQGRRLRGCCNWITKSTEILLEREVNSTRFLDWQCGLFHIGTLSIFTLEFGVLPFVRSIEREPSEGQIRKKITRVWKKGERRVRRRAKEEGELHYNVCCSSTNNSTHRSSQAKLLTDDQKKTRTRVSRGVVGKSTTLLQSALYLKHKHKVQHFPSTAKSAPHSKSET